MEDGVSVSWSKKKEKIEEFCTMGQGIKAAKDDYSIIFFARVLKLVNAYRLLYTGSSCIQNRDKFV